MSESVLLDLDNYKMEQMKFQNEFTNILTSPIYSSDLSETYMMSSASSSSRSPMSTASDNSQSALTYQVLGTYEKNIKYTMDTSMDTSMDSIPSPLYETFDTQGNIVCPKLFIKEQPIDKFRFRYKSEMHGTHGSLIAKKSEKSKKEYPTVELQGYNGEAIIRCSLFQTEKDTLKRSPHSHRLVVRNGDEDHDDPHDVVVSPEKGFTAVFRGMGIIHTAKKYIAEELVKKKVLEKQVELGRVLTARDEQQIKKLAEQEAKNMNLNQVCLGFQAFAVENSEWRKLCDPVYSTPINNMKSALTGELKITRLSAAVSSAAGGDDLILLVEKVGKKNIKVRFFELDDEDREIWEANGNFTEVDVHHQYAIALRTPPYRNIDITQPVDVYIQLYRPSDHERSEYIPFKYKPRNYINSRKRPRTSTNTSFSSNEIPTTVCSIPSMSLSDTIDSSEVNMLINELNLPPDGEIPKLDSDFVKFYNENSKSWNANLGVEPELQTDSPSSVIQRGPCAPPLQPRRPAHNFDTLFKDICATYRNELNNPKALRVKILKKITETIIDGENLIHWAIKGDTEFKIISNIFKIIDQLELSELLQTTTSNDETCLHIACEQNKPEYIRPLINLGADPNIPDGKGNTPLHVAVELLNEMCVSKILDKTNYTARSKELKIDLANHQGMTALHLAVRQNNLKIVKALLENNASIKISESKRGCNALHIATEEECEDIVKYLLENTAIKIDQTNSSGYTPLHLACVNRSLSIIQLLLKHNANPNLTYDNNDDENSDDENSGIETESQTVHNAFHIARNSPQVLGLLKQNSTTSCVVKRELQIDESHYMETEEYTDQHVKFDDDCLIALCGIFNRQHKWKKLADALHFSDNIKIWELSSNPTKSLLLKIQNQKITIINLIKVFNDIGENDAATEIDAMISRDGEKDPADLM